MIDGLAGEERGLPGEQGLQERRLLLLGPRGSGKSSTGNTLLGRDQFAVGASLGQGVVGAWLIAVVDTPGWTVGQEEDERGNGEEESDILRSSLRLCAPGPHAVLLTVPISQSFTQVDRLALGQRVAQLGHSAWKYCLLVFTGGDRLQESSSIEEYIIQAGEELRLLLEQCGNHYHVIDNTPPVVQSRAQATELLLRVEEMVQENHGQYLEVARLNPQEEQEYRWRNQREEHRRMSSEDRLQLMFRSPPRELRMLLLGWRGSGKTSAGNVILGVREFHSGRQTQRCVRRQALVAGRRLTLVDTPGWDWFSYERTPAYVRQEARRGARLLHPGPHALLLVLPVVSTLSKRKRRTLEKHLQLFGTSACLHTLVLFSCGDWLGRTPIEEHIQRGGTELLRLVELCDSYYHVLDCSNASSHTQVPLLLEKVEDMIKQNQEEPFLPVELVLVMSYWDCFVSSGESVQSWDCFVSSGESVQSWDCFVSSGESVQSWDCFVSSGENED
ncbi:GTPase IMAP family member 8 [Chanos chanos]|uniref:GTPase IMAP family member 8 n=1 Tax=Chanos chanos TaxID=29144 RepID=A0A6J2WY18_CHACN|nr:GTPase IMAP family member 8-like [Chanos chanos]